MLAHIHPHPDACGTPLVAGDVRRLFFSGRETPRLKAGQPEPHTAIGVGKVNRRRQNVSRFGHFARPAQAPITAPSGVDVFNSNVPLRPAALRRPITAQQTFSLPGYPQVTKISLGGSANE